MHTIKWGHAYKEKKTLKNITYTMSSNVMEYTNIAMCSCKDTCFCTKY